MSYAVQSGSSVTVDGSTGALTWVSAGETVIRASYAETQHYAAGYIDVTVTTYKAEQTATDSAFTFTYNGDNQLSVSTLDGATVTYSVATSDIVTVNEAGALTWVSAGDAEVTAAIAETDHYLSKTVTVAVAAEKAEQNPSALPVDFTYGGTASIEVTGLEDTPTVSYAVQSGTSVSVDGSTGELTWVSAGESVIRASFTETTHYAGGYIDVAVTAEKAEQTATDSAFTFTYNGDNQLSVSTLDGATVTYSVATTDIVTVTEAGALTWVSAGDAEVTAAIAETDHYLSKTVTVTVTAEKAEQAPSADPVAVPYGGVGSISVTGLGDTPDLTYEVTEGTSVTVDDDGNVSWVSTGVSTVRVSFAETTHYLGGHIDVTVTANSAINMDVTVVGDKAIAVANLAGGYSKSTTICLYSDAECTTAVVSPGTVTVSSAVYNYTIPGSGTYYIGVWGGGTEDLLAAEPVSISGTDPFRVNGQNLVYNVDLGNIEGTVSIKEDSTVVFTDSESPFQGNFSDWGYSHDYTLVVTVSGTEITIKTLTLSSAISGLTASVSRQDVDYTVTSVTYPLTIYICDSSLKVVGSRSLAVDDTGGTITSTVNYGTTYNAYVYKSGLGIGDTIDPSKCPSPVSVNISATFAEFTVNSISAGEANINITYNYDWDRSDWDGYINIQVYDSGVLADSENSQLWGSYGQKADSSYEVYNLNSDSVGGSVTCLLDNYSSSEKVYTLRIYSMTYNSAGSELLVESVTITIPPDT